jgi:hypothetical protein
MAKHPGSVVVSSKTQAAGEAPHDQIVEKMAIVPAPDAPRLSV